MGEAARRVDGATRIRVVTLTGFLGAGKTTALNDLLAEPPEPNARMAVIVNEFGELGVDAELVAPGAVRTWEVRKGSLFCTCTQADLQRVLTEARAHVRPDWLLIETTGLAEPRDLSSILDSPGLAAGFEMRLSICLVDPLTFPKIARSLVAARAQVLAADTVLLNKCDLVDEGARATVEARVREIDPDVFVVRTTMGHLPRDVFRAGRRRSRLVAREPRSAPPAGIATVSYESSTAVDRRRFYDLVQSWGPRCLRAKGRVLFADGPLFVEVVGGRPSSRPLATGAEWRTRFVVILDRLDPAAVLASLRACERDGPARRLKVSVVE